LVLGGGGALGDFELGVLQYLYRYNIRPQIICGTSVGAINAAKLAEGEGTPQETDRGFKGLQNIWLQNMNSPSDMYVEEPAFAALPDDIQGAILSQLAKSAAAGLIFGGLFNSILAIFGFGSSDADKVQAFLNSSALYNLSPIENLARQRLSLNLIGGSGIKLRMAMVSLETGALKYTTESGSVLLDGEAPDPSIQPQLSLIFDGMLASAAIPGFFKMRKIGNENFVDGGIRVNVPIKAALDLGGIPSRLYPMGNLEVLVHFTETTKTIPPSTTDYLATCYFDFKENQWFGPFEIIADGNLITGVTGKPVIIQSDFGNFEIQERRRFLQTARVPALV